MSHTRSVFPIASPASFGSLYQIKDAVGVISLYLVKDAVGVISLYLVFGCELASLTIPLAREGCHTIERKHG